VSTVAEMMDTLATGIATKLCASSSPVIPELQVDNRQNPNPSPPSIDIYPGTEPFTEQIGFGPDQRSYNFTVRARVGTSDNEAGQDLLLAMMDDASAQSVEVAVWTVSGVKSVVGPTPYAAFRDVGGEAEWLGCTWRVQFMP
jgi:hypothetical protein